MATKKIEKSVTYPLRMEKSLRQAYANFCEKNGLVMSARLRYLMQKDLDKKLKIGE